MYAPYCIAALALLVIIIAACLCRKGGSREGFGRRVHNDRNDRNWPAAYYWHRGLRPGRGSHPFGAWPRRPADPDMRWWRHPGFAAPLELSLPLHNFREYLYGYPPASRLPYNA